MKPQLLDASELGEDDKEAVEAVATADDGGVRVNDCNVAAAAATEDEEDDDELPGGDVASVATLPRFPFAPSCSPTMVTASSYSPFMRYHIASQFVACCKYVPLRVWPVQPSTNDSAVRV